MGVGEVGVGRHSPLCSLHGLSLLSAGTLEWGKGEGEEEAGRVGEAVVSVSSLYLAAGIT